MSTDTNPNSDIPGSLAYVPKAEAESSTSKSAPEAKASEETSDESESSVGKEDAELTESEETEGEDQETESDDDKGTKKGKNGFQKKVNKLTRQRAEARAEVEFWKQQALKGQSATPETPKQIPKASDSAAPNPDDYESNADYQAALVEYKVDQTLSAREKSAAAQKQKQEFAAKYEEVKASHEDWDDVMDSVEHIKVAKFAMDKITESDLGPEFAYQLAKHPADYERLAKLQSQPEAFIRALGKLEAKFSSTATEKPKTESIKKTAAPAPISPVGGKASPPKKSIFDKDLPFAEYEKLRRAELQNKR